MLEEEIQNIFALAKRSLAQKLKENVNSEFFFNYYYAELMNLIEKEKRINNDNNEQS